MLIIVPQLFSDYCPKTSANFEALCTGERGLTKSDIPLCYKDSLFHRVVPNGWVQGGGRQLAKAVQNTNSSSQAYLPAPKFKLDCWRKLVSMQIAHRSCH